MLTQTMKSKNNWSTLALSFLLCGVGLGETADMSTFNRPDGGPPAKWFAAAASHPVSAIQAAAAKASVVPKDATYPFSLESPDKSTIHSDWAFFKEGAALSWVADMDVDCDGINEKCEGNGDGQPQTNWGYLAAYTVPYIVIPDRFLNSNKDILPGNNIAAVICNKKMYYGILGDSNGDDPQITGEASWLMAKTCFPGEDLQGNKAHSTPDVTYIVFTGKGAVLPDNALNEKYITDFNTLRSMGDKLVKALASNLGSASTPTSTVSPAAPSSGTGREGVASSSDDCCSDDLGCSDDDGSVKDDDAGDDDEGDPFEGQGEGERHLLDNDDCSDDQIRGQGVYTFDECQGQCEECDLCSEDEDCYGDLFCDGGSSACIRLA
ncbi:hypothetical protein BBP40_012111 [Aspergillus hancockii]|nr:hypothetical protein BBP40_012111 [Aspergillus hancockii]